MQLGLGLGEDEIFVFEDDDDCLSMIFSIIYVTTFLNFLKKKMIQLSDDYDCLGIVCKLSFLNF